MKVAQMMSTQFETCQLNTNLELVARRMWDCNIGTVLVVNEEGKPVGIITDRDISMGAALNHKALWDMCTGDVTNNRPLYSCSTEDMAETALSIMAQQKVRRIPVVDEAGLLAGVLSIEDVVASAQKTRRGKNKPVSYEDVVITLKELCEDAVH